jgi:TetR/AcrR family transcriptional repressor of nem operon
MPSFVISPIMKGAGLTHGGFYGHFRSKDQLAAEAVTRALDGAPKDRGISPT